jgi:hypothetical protein
MTNRRSSSKTIQLVNSGNVISNPEAVAGTSYFRLVRQ